MDFKEILGDAYTPEAEQRLKQAIGKDFVSRVDFNEKNEALKASAATIKERDAQIAELGKQAKTDGELAAKIKELTESNKAATDKYAADLKTANEERRLDIELLKHNPVSLKALKAELDLSKLKYSEDKLEGLTEQIDAIKKSADLKVLLKGESSGSIAFGANDQKQKQTTDTLESVISERIFPGK